MGPTCNHKCTCKREAGDLTVEKVIRNRERYLQVLVLKVEQRAMSQGMNASRCKVEKARKEILLRACMKKMLVLAS